MNVKELIYWLQTQDEEAIVQVVIHERGTGYYDQGGNAHIADFDLSETQYNCPSHYEYTDFRGNQFVKEDTPYYNKRFLLLGSKE